MSYIVGRKVRYVPINKIIYNSLIYEISEIYKDENSHYDRIGILTDNGFVEYFFIYTTYGIYYFL